jgi:N utilization substance protein B
MMTISQEDGPEHLYGPNDIVLCDQLPARDQRTVLFHLLYMLDVCDYQMSIEAAIEQFSKGFLCELTADGSIAHRLRSIVEHRAELDKEIKPLLHNWKFERLSIATRLILRLALWELRHTDLDIAVVINEALELAKSFAEVDAYKFINGLLDEWVKQNCPERIVVKLQSNPSE